ncbi:MAG TPA: hypothetical protein VGF27_26635, partial [Pseudoduganella sp.]
MHNLMERAAAGAGREPLAHVGATPSARSRIAVIDVLRGLVMLIMLFDHVREAIYQHVALTDPLTVTG